MLNCLDKNLIKLSWLGFIALFEVEFWASLARLFVVNEVFSQDVKKMRFFRKHVLGTSEVKSLNILFNLIFEKLSFRFDTLLCFDSFSVHRFSQSSFYKGFSVFLSTFADKNRITFCSWVLKWLNFCFISFIGEVVLHKHLSLWFSTWSWFWASWPMRNTKMLREIFKKRSAIAMHEIILSFTYFRVVIF